MDADKTPLPQEMPRPPEAEEGIDLLALGHTLYRHKLSILLLTLLVVMVTTLVVYRQTPIYQAETSLMIERKAGKVVSIEQIYNPEGSNNEYLQTQFELIKSRSLAERVVRELGLTEHPEFDPRQRPAPTFDWRGWLGALELSRWLPVTRPADLRPPEEPAEQRIFEGVVSTFLSRVSVAPKRNTQLVTIEVEMADPVLAAKAANALAQGYIDSQFEARLGMSQAAAGWMSDRLAELKTALETSEQRLQDYREEQNLVDVAGVASLSGQELSQIGTRMVEADRELASIENQYQQIETMKGAGWERQATVPAVLSDAMVQQFRAEVARARAKVEELSGRYGPKHPTMIAARTDLNSATANLRTQVEQKVASIERNYQLAKANVESLRSSFNANREEIQTISRKEFKLKELQREAETNRTLYETFMTRLKETTATADIDTPVARIVDRAMVPKSPARPQKGRIITIAALLALLAGIGLALLRERLDNRVRGPEDVEAKLGLPSLGILPLKKKLERTAMARLYLDDADKRFSEAVRTIRTGVVLSGLDNPHKIIVVTSSVPGEGKTSLTTNLAFALGQLERVLLVEADMRRPTFTRIFGFTPGAPGLANLVAGTVPLGEVIQRLDPIDILPCGTVPPNPLELLSSQRFAQLLDELGETYDRILIDSAPVEAVSDALVLASQASSVIYVIKSDTTPLPIIARGLRRLWQHKAPLAGVVINQVDVHKAARYGSYGGYYRGYYRGYYGGYGRGGYGGYYDHYGYSKGEAAKG